MLVQTGQVDGVLTDLQSTGLLNKDGVKIKAVYTSRRPFPGAPIFRILAGPKTTIKLARRSEGRTDRHQLEHDHGIPGRSHVGC